MWYLPNHTHVCTNTHLKTRAALVNTMLACLCACHINSHERLVLLRDMLKSIEEQSVKDVKLYVMLSADSQALEDEARSILSSASVH